MTLTDDLLSEATAIRILGGDIVDATHIGTYAVEYAVHNWQVFPLKGKVPAIPNPHPKGSPERLTCKGECGRQGHGVYDATTDVEQIAHWWGGPYRGCNIGLRVPEAMIVIDIDPRSGGLHTLAEWAEKFGTLPDTLTTISGRRDGGMHLYYRRPHGKLSIKRLRGTGVDLKNNLGYVVGAPSIHPDTGQPYERLDKPVATPPAWLIKLLKPEREQHQPRTKTRHLRSIYTGPSIADEFTAHTSWADILEHHGWTCLDADPDADGARWRHPTATSAWSATIRHSCLFVYSPNTPFGITEAGYPQGNTKFRAYAVLDHNGDLKAAAKALRETAIR